MLAKLKPKEVIFDELFKIYSNSTFEDRTKIANSNYITINNDGKVFVHTNNAEHHSGGIFESENMWYMGIISNSYRNACVCCMRKYTIEEFINYVTTM